MTMMSRSNHVQVLLFGVVFVAHSFVLRPIPTTMRSPLVPSFLQSMPPPPGESFVVILGDDDDDDDDREEEEEEEDEEDETEVDGYTQTAREEFQEMSTPPTSSSSALTTKGMNGGGGGGGLVTKQDWGGALGKLRQRMEDMESGKSDDPSHLLFRVMSSQTPNQLIGKFVTTANPQTVQAMSGAVSSLLGGRYIQFCMWVDAEPSDFR